MKRCGFCGREIKRRDVGAMELAGTIGLTLTGLLIAIESVAADLGHDDPTNPGPHDLAVYPAEILPLLSTVTLPQMMRATGLIWLLLEDPAGGSGAASDVLEGIQGFGHLTLAPRSVIEVMSVA